MFSELRRDNLYFHAMSIPLLEQCEKYLAEEKPRLFYTNGTDENRFNTFYDNANFPPLWQRKVYAIPRAFWYGILCNIKNIYEAATASLSFFYHAAKDSNLFTRKLTDLTQSELYYRNWKWEEILKKLRLILPLLYLSFGHAYSFFNDRRGRYHIDAAETELFFIDYKGFGCAPNVWNLILGPKLANDQRLDFDDEENFTLWMNLLSSPSWLQLDALFLKILFDEKSFSEEKEQYLERYFKLIDKMLNHEKANTEVRQGLLQFSIKIFFDKMISVLDEKTSLTKVYGKIFEYINRLNRLNDEMDQEEITEILVVFLLALIAQREILELDNGEEFFNQLTVYYEVCDNKFSYLMACLVCVDFFMSPHALKIEALTMEGLEDAKVDEEKIYEKKDFLSAELLYGFIFDEIRNDVLDLDQKKKILKKAAETYIEKHKEALRYSENPSWCEEVEKISNSNQKRNFWSEKEKKQLEKELAIIECSKDVRQKVRDFTKMNPECLIPLKELIRFHHLAEKNSLTDYYWKEFPKLFQSQLKKTYNDRFSSHPGFKSFAEKYQGAVYEDYRNQVYKNYIKEACSDIKLNLTINDPAVVRSWVEKNSRFFKDYVGRVQDYKRLLLDEDKWPDEALTLISNLFRECTIEAVEIYIQSQIELHCKSSCVEKKDQGECWHDRFFKMFSQEDSKLIIAKQIEEENHIRFMLDRDPSLRVQCVNDRSWSLLSDQEKQKGLQLLLCFNQKGRFKPPKNVTKMIFSYAFDLPKK